MSGVTSRGRVFLVCFVRSWRDVEYFIEYLGVVTLREYSDVYGDVVKLGVKGRTSSSVDTCAGPGSVKKDFEEYRRASGLSAFIWL